jgi:hypothetical protein
LRHPLISTPLHRVRLEYGGWCVQDSDASKEKQTDEFSAVLKSVAPSSVRLVHWRGCVALQRQEGQTVGETHWVAQCDRPMFIGLQKIVGCPRSPGMQCQGCTTDQPTTALASGYPNICRFEPTGANARNQRVSLPPARLADNSPQTNRTSCRALVVDPDRPMVEDSGWATRNSP